MEHARARGRRRGAARAPAAARVRRRSRRRCCCCCCCCPPWRRLDARRDHHRAFGARAAFRARRGRLCPALAAESHEARTGAHDGRWATASTCTATPTKTLLSATAIRARLGGWQVVERKLGSSVASLALIITTVSAAASVAPAAADVRTCSVRARVFAQSFRMPLQRIRACHAT